MKIGEFSKMFDTSIDTIRFYVESGLLLPEKVHNQRIFDTKCVSDMRLIQKYKDMKFTIADIKKIFSLKRLTGFIGYHGEYYLGMLSGKRDELVNEMNNITNSIETIDREMQVYTKLSQKKAKKNFFGIPLPFISYLACPFCGENLFLDKASIEDNKIMNGDLSCSCGYHAAILEGIIVVGDRETKKEDDVDLDEVFRDIYTDDNAEELEKAFRSHDWYMRRIEFDKLDGKLILRWGTGEGVLLRYFIENLKSFRNSFYVATDNRYALLKRVKETMEKITDDGVNVVFVVAEYDEIPLKRESADMIIDTFSSTDMIFEKGINGLERIAQYLKKGGLWYGGYLYFEKPIPMSMYKHNENMNKLTLEYLEEQFSGFSKKNSSKIAEFKFDTDKSLGFKADVNAGYWMYYGEKK